MKKLVASLSVFALLLSLNLSAQEVAKQEKKEDKKECSSKKKCCSSKRPT